MLPDLFGDPVTIKPPSEALVASRADEHTLQAQDEMSLPRLGRARLTALLSSAGSKVSYIELLKKMQGDA